MSLFPLTDRTQLLLEDILYFEGEGNYTFVYYRNRPAVLLSKSIGFLMERLPEGLFIRISRKYAIHKNAVSSLQFEQGEREVTFFESITLTVSRRRWREFKKTVGTKPIRLKKTAIKMQKPFSQ